MERKPGTLELLLVYVPLTLLALGMLAPFAWMVVAALMPRGHALRFEFVPPGNEPLMERLGKLFS